MRYVDEDRSKLGLCRSFTSTAAGKAPGMDAQRYEALIHKRDDVGLSDQEADELGRMIAEREGADYENADTVQAEAEKEPPARA